MNLTWIRRGQSLSLHTGNIYHRGSSGLGLAPFERYESRGPMQDGATDEGYRLLPRVMTLLFAIAHDEWDGLFDLREQMIEAFAPGNDVAVLRWIQGSRIRDIDVTVLGGLDFSTEDRQGKVENFVVNLKADNPTWYDPEALAYTFLMDPSQPGTSVPTPVPTPVGASSLYNVQTIEYVGNAISYPHFIRILGPVVNPKIMNVTTGDELDFYGTSLGVGEYIDLDLRFDKKIVVDHNGNNRVDNLTDASDLSTFAIVPWANNSSARENAIEVYGEATSSLTRFEFVVYNRYLGI